MKEQVIHYGKSQSQQISQDTSIEPQLKLYKWTMPLLTFAALEAKESYAKTFQSMEFLLNESNDSLEKPWELWIVGRMALASKLIEDQQNLTVLKEKLAKDLFRYDNKDVITGWAFAYFAALDKDSYALSRDKLFEYTEYAKANFKLNPEQEGSNLIWTYVMNLFAAANAENRQDYVYFLNALKEATDKHSLGETSLLVPLTDYRQWLVSLARYSFTIMQDTESLDTLKSIAVLRVESFDAMLAWTNELLIEKSALKNHSQYSLKF